MMNFALDTAKMILEKHPGKWEIKYNEKNDVAKRLWNAVVAPHEPEVHHLNEEETRISHFLEELKVTKYITNAKRKKITICIAN